MKLSKESIDYILGLQKKILPNICFSNSENIRVIKDIIMNYNGKVSFISKDNKKDIKSINTLLIFMESLNEEESFNLEKLLINLGKQAVVILDAKGIDSVIYKRNLVLSFLNRGKIGIIKGTKSQIEALIKVQDNSKIYNIDTNFKYRDFSKKNNIILIVEDEGYYITEGYSELYIQDNNIVLDKEILDCIYECILSVGVSVCKNKCEMVQAILISTLVFIISKEMAVVKFEKEFMDEGDYEYNKDETLYKYIIDEIHEITSKSIEDCDKIRYSFKS